MFDDLQKLFSESLRSFREELGRREPEDQIAELLGAMRREMVDARVALRELDDAVGRAEAELAGEQEQLARCERRGALAQRIDDGETARVAAEFADRHRERAAVLRRKVEALRAERRLKGEEAEQMKRRYQDADRNRFALLAQLRRAGARQRMDASTSSEAGAFADFARVEQGIEGEAAYAEALEELADEPPAGTRAPPPDVDERLRELKRRMGRD